MPDREELEVRLMEQERSIKEFPDTRAWLDLKAEVERQYAPEPEEEEHGDD